MSALLGASFLVVGFLAVFQLLDLTGHAKRAIDLARGALFDIGRRDLDDDEKEKALRLRAVGLLKVTGILFAGGAAAALLPAAVIWALDRFGVLSWDAVMEASFSWEFLLAAAVATTVALWLLARRKPAKSVGEKRFESRYSATSRALHNVAFASTPAQVALADLEDRWMAKKLRAEDARRPVFITALPRAGTTLLLELCAGSGEFATHTYRHMPFVFTPALWHRFTRSMQVAGELRERAHGDGMMVNEDSPEAFEEMLWAAYWEDHYKKDRIVPWGAEANGEFLEFFRRHMQKIVLLARSGEAAAPARYVSKNNLNIARIPWLAAAFPEARFLVPFRDPLQHAASLLRQHGNFLAIHAQDAFARNYMAAIGHFDFGDNLRPVNFGGWLDRGPLPSPTELDFWLRYWIAAYESLLGQVGGRVALLDYDRFCAEPGGALERIATFLEIADVGALVSQRGRVKLKPPSPSGETGYDPALLDRAIDLRQRLAARSLFVQA